MAGIDPLVDLINVAYSKWSRQTPGRRLPPTLGEHVVAGITRVGRMCPYCLMWSEDDDEACPGSCNESDDIDAAPAKRFRIYRTGV